MVSMILASVIYLATPATPLLAKPLVKASPSADVNPFIGASCVGDTAGKTFPGATTPFGMVQLSPDTITGGDNGPGYSYEHQSIEGFSFTHMSGVGWYGDLGNLLVMPTTGPLVTNSGRETEKIDGYRSLYRHETESARPGYYAVTLDRYGVRVEAAAAPKAGILRFTFPQNSQSRIQIDLARRVGGTATEENVQVVDDHTIKGWMRCIPEGGGWGNGDGHPDYTVYFVGKFSKPLTTYGTWTAEPPVGQPRKREWVESPAFQAWLAGAVRHPMARSMTAKHLGFYAEFATQANEQISFKAGISFSSMEGAAKNLEADIPDWNFDGARTKAAKLWDDALGKVEIQGGTSEERAVFRTAMYHAMIDPRDASDVSGEHPSGDGKTRVDKAFTYRTVFSGWDVFRSQFPLQTLINPKVVNDEINSLIQLADTSGKGYLERWEFLNAYSGCMVGNPAIPVIADAYSKGIRDFPVQHAYELAVATGKKFGNPPACFFPQDLSKTLEYGFDDWCTSQFAAWLGKPKDAALYADRAQAYRKIFDPSVGWFRARTESGAWAPWPEKGKLAWVWCVESNPNQQGWFVPHDPSGLAQLLGGQDKASSVLDAFFAKTPHDMGWNDYYNHSNEPVHHVPFLFNAWGHPWLTQKWTHEVIERAYHNQVNGICGNDDVGQMSAWYVLAAMGFHPLCPGNGRYEICGPLFDKMTLHLDEKYASGKTFTIRARRANASDIYIQSATLNGKPFSRSWIGHNEIARGGELDFVMGSSPNRSWGSR
jgi:predicted alpha-1,2-mannosidase